MILGFLVGFICGVSLVCILSAVRAHWRAHIGGGLSHPSNCVCAGCREQRYARTHTHTSKRRWLSS